MIVDDIVQNMKKIQDILHDVSDSRITYADVTERGLTDTMEAMGFKIGQIPGTDKWSWIKTTTVQNEAKSFDIIPTGSTSLQELSNEPLNVVVENIVDNAGFAEIELSTPSVLSFGNVASGVLDVACLASVAYQFGYIFGESEYNQNVDFWHEVATQIFKFGDTSKYPILIDANGNIKMSQEALDVAYEVFAGLESGDSGEWYDANGDKLPAIFSRSFTFESVGTEDLPSGVVKRVVEVYPEISNDGILAGAYKYNVGDSIFYALGLYINTNIVPGGTSFNYVFKYTDTDTNWNERTYYQTTPITVPSTTSNYDVSLGGISYAFGGLLSVPGFNSNFYTSYPGINVPTVTELPTRMNNGITQVVPTLPEITGTTHPRNGGTFSGTYPKWSGRGKNVKVSDDSDSLNEYDTGLTPYVPFWFPSKDYINNSDASNISDIQDGTKDLPITDPDTNENIKDNVDEATDESTDEREDTGYNPYIPGGNGDTGDTDDPQIFVPGYGGELTGLTTIYNPTRQQLVSFSQWLWSPSFIDNIKKLFQDPMSAIIGLSMLYATPVEAGTAHIVVGYLDSGVSSPYVTNTTITIDCGTISIPYYYKNALDCNPYTEVDIFLPFIGFKSLSANDIVGGKLNVKYNIDVITGTCVAFLTSIKTLSSSILYTFSGNCGVQLPLSSSNFSSIISGILTTAVSVGATVATGGLAAPIAATAVAGTVANSRVGVERSGSITGNSGALSPKKPYLVVRRPVSKVTYKYNDIIGYPASSKVRLRNMNGYVRVKEIHLDSLNATEQEKQELESLLKEGIII